MNDADGAYRLRLSEPLERDRPAMPTVAPRRPIVLVLGMHRSGTSLRMPGWHQLVSGLRWAPKLVLCLRNPAQAARSLQARDGLDPELGEYRWRVHTIDFCRYAGSREFCAVEYEKWFDEPRSN